MNLCLTVKEAARIIQINSKNVYYLGYMGYLEGWKIRGAWRFYRASVEEYARGKNQGGADSGAPVNFNHQGNGRLFTMFGPNSPAHDLGPAAPRLPDRRRVEQQPRRLNQLPLKTFQPVAQGVLFPELFTDNTSAALVRAG